MGPARFHCATLLLVEESKPSLVPVRPCSLCNETAAAGYDGLIAGIGHHRPGSVV